MNGAAGVSTYLLTKSHQGRSPAGVPHLFKATGADTAGRFEVMVASFEPMTGPPLHWHRHQDDTFFILEGVLTVQAGEDVFDIGPGDFLSIPPGMVHTFDNLHNDGGAARAINIMTPAGLFEMFDEMGQVPEGLEQDDRLSAIGERHDTYMVGPPLRVRLGISNRPG